MAQDIKEAMRQKAEEAKGVVQKSFKHVPVEEYFESVCRLCGATYNPMYNGVCPAKILEYKF